MNESFFKFSIGFLCIILGSFGVTVLLSNYQEDSTEQTASVFQAAFVDRLVR